MDSYTYKYRSPRLSAHGVLTSLLSAQTIFDIGAQRSDPLLPLSAPPFFDISAQRSYLILDRRSALKTSISARFFFIEIDLENFVKSRKIGKNQRSALRPILLPALSAQGNFSKSLSAQGPPLAPSHLSTLKNRRFRI